jgi:hypothetical protein
VGILGGWLLLTLATAFVLLAGMAPPAVAITHVLVAAGAAIALGLKGGWAERAGAIDRWNQGFAVLLVALVVGLVPLPAGIREAVAPGTSGTGASIATLSVDPGATLGEIGRFVLAGGFGALVCAWGAARFRRSEAETAIATFGGALAVIGMGHHFLGMRAAFGVINPRELTPYFFAPFVDPNHLGSAMLLAFPVALARVVDSRSSVFERVHGALTGALMIAAMMSVQSFGVFIVAAVIGLLVLARNPWLRGTALAVYVVAAAAVVSRASMGAWGQGSISSRSLIWRDALGPMFARFPLTGTGGGTFSEAFAPYRSDSMFIQVSHAHSDWIEWMVETGLVGVALGGVAVYLLWPPKQRNPERFDGMAWGIGAVLLHATIDFPLQLPAMAMALAAVLACRLTVFGERVPSSAMRVRAALFVWGLLQVPFAVYSAREQLVETARGQVLAFSTDPEAANAAAGALAFAKAGRPERELLAAWNAEVAGDADHAAQHALAASAAAPSDARIQRLSALVLGREGRLDEASRIADAAILRGPSDWRNRAARARIAAVAGDRLEAVEAWASAFDRGAPVDQLPSAYDVFPVPLVWVDVLATRPASISLALGSLLMSRHEPAVAALAVAQSSRIDPTMRYRNARLQVATLVAAEREEDAARWIDVLRSERPDDPVLLELHGDLELRAGRYSSASDAYYAASASNPALRVEAFTAAARDSTDAAIGVMRRLELSGVEDPMVEFAYVEMLANDRQFEKCASEIERRHLDTEVGLKAKASKLLTRCQRGK